MAKSRSDRTKPNQKAKKRTYENQTRDANGRFGPLKVKTKLSISKSNYNDFEVAKTKLINIQSKVINSWKVAYLSY